MTLFPRTSGVLLHPTSLPAKYGIGDLGKSAYDFVDWLVKAHQSLWQVLPLGPTSYGDSPYQCLSAFAGNTNLISLDMLVNDGWLTDADVADVPNFPIHTIDFGPVIEYHNKMLALAYSRFKSKATPAQRKTFDKWRDENATWLPDWSLFIALKNLHGGKPWVEWDEGLALKQADAIAQAKERLADEIIKHEFYQWLFFTQWSEIKQYANNVGVKIIGDIPIFVAHDSSDVWGNREIFQLDPKGNPTVVAGVPPDYFSKTGQYWGNPLYNWDKLKATDYQWWIDRIAFTLKAVDYVRIDHFRGFEAYWEVTANPERYATKKYGKWVKAPGADLFSTIQKKLGDSLPIIAEDLGDISKEVIELRDQFNLPGMKILQFAWSEPKNPFLPHNYVNNCVVYSGTHDNNTTLGWWRNETDDNTKRFLSAYIDKEVIEPHWTLIRLGMASAAHTFIAPMQDVLGYGAETRMNTPGRESGNWGWRFTEDVFSNNYHDRLAYLTWLYRRRADQQVEVYGDVAVTDDEDETEG
ncbi:MAG: 4-alpha-glucanotransferase [Phototrophicales bacterium]|nr:MAG: 4-alpha-glucanotransferase [Phototrophicales bacterium]